MDVNLRDGLIIIGLLIIAIVLLDGYRRVRRSDGRIKSMRLDMNDPENLSADDASYNAELPNGGARVLPASTKDDMLTTFSATSTPQSMNEGPLISAKKRIKKRHKDKPKPEITAKVPTEPPPKHPTVRDHSEQAAQALTCDEVIIIHVQAEKGQPFNGEALLAIIEGKGLCYGEMGIFHYFENAEEKQQPAFSMANGVEPGHFNIDTLPQMQVPAVSFFMTLPGFGQPLQIFEHMLSTAIAITQALGGTLRDEDRNLLTQQARAHCRQRVIDFERRQLLNRTNSW